MDKIIFVTGNENKFKEYNNCIGDIIERKKIDLVEIQGTSEEIIKQKAIEAFRLLKKQCIVEDTSFEIEEWNKLPGPYMKYFEKEMGVSKLSELSLGSKAKAICLIGYAKSEEEIIVFRGEIEGKVVSPRINNGFGFDRIFVPDGFEKSFSEMTVEEKNEISHRRLAMDKLKEYMSS